MDQFQVCCVLLKQKKFPNAYWINDFRDPMNTPLVSIMLRGRYLKIQNESLYLSDAITAVSNGY